MTHNDILDLLRGLDVIYEEKSAALRKDYAQELIGIRDQCGKVGHIWGRKDVCLICDQWKRLEEAA